MILTIRPPKSIMKKKLCGMGHTLIIWKKGKYYRTQNYVEWGSLIGRDKALVGFSLLNQDCSSNRRLDQHLKGPFGIVLVLFSILCLDQSMLRLGCA